MRTRSLGLFTIVIVALLAPGTAGGQTQASGAGGGARTPWGDPDLHGIWTNTTTTPMQRPEDLKGREFLTDEERATRNPGSGLSTEVRSTYMPTGAYNDYWLEKGELSERTSLIVDPPNGRYPAMTPGAQQRQQKMRAAFLGDGIDSWKDLRPYDRCITRGMPDAMSPGFYNHNSQILQTPDHVVILVEMIHDARIIPLEGRGQLSPSVKQWLGYSRGRWEGDTLVIETTNLPEGERTVIERLTRIDADTIDYRITVTDPAEWTGPWTALMPMTAFEGPVFEYACHEGNYALPGRLGGARADQTR